MLSTENFCSRRKRRCNPQKKKAPETTSRKPFSRVSSQRITLPRIAVKSHVERSVVLASRILLPNKR